MQFKTERYAVPSEKVMQIQSESACSSGGMCTAFILELFNNSLKIILYKCIINYLLVMNFTPIIYSILKIGIIHINKKLY